MSNIKPVWRGLILLVIGAAIGYFVGVGIDAAVQGQFNFTAPVGGLFALLIGAILFFFGVNGYQGITRGLVWQLLGTLAGALFVTLIRLLMGLQPLGPFVFTEPAWVLGGLVGALSFVAGVGAVSDWWKWARGIETPEEHHEMEGSRKYLGVSLDHKVIGVQYTMLSLLLISIGGTFAMIFRTELAQSQLQFLTKSLNIFDQNGLQIYNTLMSLHGIVMIVSILLGVAGMINYLVPLLHRRAGYGLPALECLLVLDRRACRGAAAGPASSWAGSTPAGRGIRRFRRAPRWACRCSSWASSPRAGLPSWAR